MADVVKIEQSATAFPWSVKNFEDSLKSGHDAWVFFNDPNEITGYTLIQKVIDEVHILNICVKPKFQGQGLGRKILDHVITFSTNNAAVIIVLEVRSSNQRAQQLYLQAGFNEMSVRKEYYPAKVGREDAILMGLDLTFF